MFATIFIPDFRLQAVLRHEPQLGNAPVALMDAGNSAKAIVIECTAAARDAGVCFGLSAPQAMARCAELIVKSRSTAAEQSATDTLLQTAYTFSPHIENTAPGVCTIDLRGLNLRGSRGDDPHFESAECEARNAESEQSLLAPAATNDCSQPSFGFFDDLVNAGKTRCSHRAALGLPTTTDQIEHAARRAEDNASCPEHWAEKIIAALWQLHLHAQIGIGGTPNLALLAARAGARFTGAQESIPLESSAFPRRLNTCAPIRVVQNAIGFFADLSVEALDPMPEVLDILKRWGIHTVGAFLALGKDRIAERLGPPALELFERASDQTIRPLNIVVPPDTFEEQMDFECDIETLEPLLFVLRRFTEQLAARIALTYRVVAELNLRLTLASGARYERAFKVPAPTADVETLFRMLHTHLENLRTDAPIISLLLDAKPCRAETQQFGLFESALRDPNHFHETLARLTALLGVERVGRPVPEQTHRPDAFRIEVPNFNPASNSPGALECDDSPSLFSRTTRPAAFGDKSLNGKVVTSRSAPNKPRSKSQGPALRRFRPPIHAGVEMEQGRPVFISTLLVNNHVINARGPWRASGDWWDQRRWLRQEWDVQTRDGAVYRLFCAEGSWFLEGVYD